MDRTDSLHCRFSTTPVDMHSIGSRLTFDFILRDRLLVYYLNDTNVNLSAGWTVRCPTECRSPTTALPSRGRWTATTPGCTDVRSRTRLACAVKTSTSGSKVQDTRCSCASRSFSISARCLSVFFHLCPSNLLFFSCISWQSILDHVYVTCVDHSDCRHRSL